MTIDILESRINKCADSVITTFTAFGRAFNVEVSDNVPAEHLNGYVKSHISNLIWNEVFERPVIELSTMIACQNLKEREKLSVLETWDE